MEEITWKNCAEQMPPNDATEIIVSACGYFTRHTGTDLRYWISTDHADWTPYTPEKWKELNK